MDTQRATKAFPTLQKRIVDVLVEQDPSGLFGTGAPNDEHDADVHAIISQLQRAKSESDVRSVLNDRLRGWIIESGKNVDEVCAQMAPAIWEAWREFKDQAG